MSQIATIGRSTAQALMSDLQKNDARLRDYSYAKPARIWAKSNIAIATTPAKVTFFTTTGNAFGNFKTANQLGDMFFLGHDIRVIIAEATGTLGKELDVGNLGVNTILHVDFDNRPVVDDELLGLYLIGPAGRFGFAGTGAAVGSVEPGAHSGHHDVFAVAPNQKVTAYIDPLSTAAAITTATWAWLVMWGWAFYRTNVG